MTEKCWESTQKSQRPEDIMNTEEGADLWQKICLKKISRWAEFMVCVWDCWGGGGKRYRNVEVGRKVSKFTWMSVILRRGEWRQRGVGVFVDNGKCLEHAECDWWSARGPNRSFPALSILGPLPALPLLLTLPVECLLIFKPQDKNHFLFEIFLDHLPQPSPSTVFSVMITLMQFL